MPRIVLVVALIALVVYALVEALSSDPDRVRLMPRWLWIAAILALPGLGAIGWLVLGRPGRGPAPPGPLGPSGRRPLAPDDDPDFLRGL